MDPTKDILQDKWPAVKDQVLHKWSLLTAEDLAGLSGKEEELVSLLRQRYKYGRIQADMEIRNWLHDCAKERARD
jgi:cell division FtsZ-interacting protein ZapD